MEDSLGNRFDDPAPSMVPEGANNNLTATTPLGFYMPLVTSDDCALNGTNENCTAAAGGGVNNGTAEPSINMFYFYEVTSSFATLLLAFLASLNARKKIRVEKLLLPLLEYFWV